MFGMVYYAGYTAGSFFLPSLADKKGRKNFFMTAHFFMGCGMLILNLAPKGYVYLIVVMLFMMGMCSSIRGPL